MLQAFWEFLDDFFGGGSLPTSADSGDWVVTDTSAAGAPTYAKVDGSAAGEAQLVLAATNEVENVCLSFGDVLAFDIDLIQSAEFRVKMNQATLDANAQVAFGLIGDRNDTIDSIAQAALFRVVGGDSTTAVVVETDDGTNNNDDVATGQTLVNAYKRFVIDFSNGKSDVRFYMDNGDGSLVRVAAGTTFDMSNYSASLQPVVQIQKASGTAVDGITIDYVRVHGTRS